MKNASNVHLSTFYDNDGTWLVNVPKVTCRLDFLSLISHFFFFLLFCFSSSNFSVSFFFIQICKKKKKQNSHPSNKCFSISFPTAKVMFGTVGAINELREKEQAEKNSAARAGRRQ